MEIYKNLLGQDCVVVTNEDGSTWSGLKSAYDEMIADREANTL
jgi:hypothetical protein